MNGSDEFGRCSSANIHHFSFSGGNLFCTEPESSVLFDGIIPTLTALDSDMWASQLFTSNVEESDYYDDYVYLYMYFATELDITPKVGRVEMVIFNCPEWGISVESIEIYIDKNYIIFPNTTSCHSLVRLCTDTELSNLPHISICFNLKSNSSWVHIAEVLVYSVNSNNNSCDYELTTGGLGILTTSLTLVLLVLIAAAVLVAIFCKLRAKARAKGAASNSAAPTDPEERQPVYDEVGEGGKVGEPNTFQLKENQAYAACHN